jgi:serine/threonine protein kinase
MDEVLVLNKLNHPNIVKYHDCYMDAVYINIVMEYCNGGDLAGLIKGREGRLMPEDEVMSLFVQVGGGGGEVSACDGISNGNSMCRWGVCVGGGGCGTVESATHATSLHMLPVCCVGTNSMRMTPCTDITEKHTP